MIQKLFGFDPATMTLRKEVIGGITTFLTMAYILAVNPSILSSTGMDAGAVFTTSCISAIVGTLVMALYAKLPFALAPGMGLNAFFAYTVVLTMGYSWQFALTAVLIEGLIFILLTVTGLRQHIVNAIPLVLRRAISPGIGLFIAFVGLHARPSRAIGHFRHSAHRSAARQRDYWCAAPRHPDYHHRGYSARCHQLFWHPLCSTVDSTHLLAVRVA